MILQTLHQRYLDLVANPESGISPLYFCSAKVSYVLEISLDGQLVDVQEIKVPLGKKLVPTRMTVPEQSSRANGINPYFLCDKAEYVIGHYPNVPGEREQIKKRTDAREKFEASRQLAFAVLDGVDDPAAVALLTFYEQWEPDEIRNHSHLQRIINDLDKGIDTTMVFRLESQGFLHHRESITHAWIRYRERKDDASAVFEAQCLITGERAAISRTHEKIKGIRGAQAAGASLVSFNFRSLDSYGKDDMQSYSAPVSKMAMFAYTTALNHLLASPRHRTVIGDMTVVFWAGNAAVEDDIEPLLAQFFENDSSPAEDLQLRDQVADILERIRQGKEIASYMVPHGDTPFYVLGLAPNKARASVRFFWQGNFGELVVRLGQHAADMAMVGLMEQERGRGTPAVYKIVNETMRIGKDGKKTGDEPPPALGGELLRAVILGTAYPFALFNMIINRVRADRIVNPLRAAILKAYLNRYMRMGQAGAHMKEELTVALHETKEPAYRLGRLFAVLERLQEESAKASGVKKLNSTIKDRYFGAASANPAAVFPVLIKLAQHHVSKAKFGEFRDRELAEIMHGMDVTEFPKRLDLQRQGMFIVGYYQQKQHIYEQIKIAADAKKGQAGAANVPDDEQEE